MTPRERFDAAVAELKKLQSEGYDIPGAARLTMSATAKVVAATPPVKTEDTAPKPQVKRSPAFRSFHDKKEVTE